MTGVELIGGEMAGWSDRRPGERPPAGGAVLHDLLSRVGPPAAGARVLVAGPHEDALVEALAGRAEVSWLLRSQPDAEAAARPGVTALCGTLAKLARPGHYDLVVALDGLGRLCSAEGPQYDWAESLHVLRRALRPGGTLVLSVENELGVHRLVDPLTHTTGEDGWRPLGEYDGTRPGNPHRLAARLREDGLRVGWLGAAWPAPGRPAMIATPDLLRNGPAGALSAYAARAFAGTDPVLTDPRRLAATAVRAGLAAEFAASWVVVAHRDKDAAAVDAAGKHPAAEHAAVDLPPLLGFDLAGPLPAGRLVEEVLIGACLRHDLATIRRVLTGWAAWSGTEPFDNVLLDGDTFTALEPDNGTALEPDNGTGPLRRFAETLIRGGYAHPWPAATDVDTLTAILTAAAGRADDEPPARQNPTGEHSAHRERIGEQANRREPTGAAATGPEQNHRPAARREQNDRLRLLESRLAETQEHLRGQETELDRLRGRLALFEGTPAYRVARLVRRALNGRKSR